MTDDATQISPQEMGHRAKLRIWLDKPAVQAFFLTVVIINAIVLGVSTSEAMTSRLGGVLQRLDDIIIGIFILEMALKLYAHGYRFFLSAWNVFDLAIVLISLVPSSETLSALRGLRVIRSMRVLSAIPQMRAVIRALFDALPGMGAVMVLMLIIFYVFAVMATLLYGGDFPQWFGSLGASLYSLFQIMTLESWSMGIVRPVMEEHPTAWAFFVPFIICTAFAVLNLFIGLLVNTMQAAVEEETEAEFERLRELVRAETDQVDGHVKELHEEIKSLREELRQARGSDT